MKFILPTFRPIKIEQKCQTKATVVVAEITTVDCATARARAERVRPEATSFLVVDVLQTATADANRAIRARATRNIRQ